MKILIIDDDNLVCNSLKTILESKGMQICSMGNNGNDAIALYRIHHPDVLLMDIRMEPLNGVEASEQILKEFPNANILFLTTFSDDEYIIRALQLGVKGYILKQNFDSIVTSLEAVHMGQNVFNTEIIAKIPNFIQPQKDNFTNNDFSEKEVSIISLVAKGLNNKELSETLFLSEGTIRNYISIILEKLNLRDRTQLAVFYYQHTQEE